MDKFAINTFMFKNRNINSIINSIDKNIIDGIGILKEHAIEMDKKKILIKDFNVISLYVIFLNLDNLERDLKNLDNYIYLCKKNKIKSITVIPQSFNNDGKKENLNKLIKLSNFLLKKVEFYDIKILFEPLRESFKNISCLHSLEEAKCLNNYIDNRYFKWIVDLYHIDSYEDIKNLDGTFISNIFSVHLSDYKKGNITNQSRLFLGEGDLEISRIINKFKENDFSGWWEFEVLSDEYINEDYNYIENKINKNINTFLL